MKNSNCLKCQHDVSDLMNWETLFDEFILCPNCGNKMAVEYDESWDGKEEISYWSLKQY
jgi:transcription elongation factor Elf1